MYHFTKVKNFTDLALNISVNLGTTRNSNAKETAAGFILVCIKFTFVLFHCKAGSFKGRNRTK